MKSNSALKVAGIIFLFVAIMHFFRFILRVEVTVAGFTVPVGLSLFGFAVASLFSLWMFKSLK